MTDQLSKAIKESGEKSAFICVNCGHHNIPDSGKKTGKQMSPVKDQFSEAVKESGEKSAFVCGSCGHAQ
jgi:transcription elongation factor Elf1